jgi:beta-glucosidase/6-phospho-beta-glucosidase/beta-galactosidase
LKSSRLPKFTPEEIKYIRGSSDFFGLNHYTTYMVKLRRPHETYQPSLYDHEDDTDTVQYVDPSWSDDPSVSVLSWGFTEILRWIRVKYNNPEVMILENGYGDRGDHEDVNRVLYIHNYLNALLDAIKEGSIITAYTVWSLMDNFEWENGYM